MLHGLLTLLAFAIAGDALAVTLGLPVPGMVIGLMLLLGALRLRARRLGAARAIPPGLAAAASGLHGHLGLLFVPAGVGVLGQAELLARDGGAILAAVLVSTGVTILVAARLAVPRRVAGSATAPPGRAA